MDNYLAITFWFLFIERAIVNVELPPFTQYAIKI